MSIPSPNGAAVQALSSRRDLSAHCLANQGLTPWLLTVAECTPSASFGRAPRARMTDFIILGTDTDAGKTTFAALWLCGNTTAYAYWKPVETGPSDTAALQQVFPDLVTAPPAQRFEDPVAPSLAARRQNATVWSARDIAAARPHVPGKSLVIESFGGPFSPLNDNELQIELIRRLNLPSVLVTSSKLGAIGR